MTMQPNQIADVLSRPISQELLARDITRLAYVAKDGTPRNIPIGFSWNGSEIVMCTPKNAAKLEALRTNPIVALTIDTEVHPPKILFIRGRAELDVVDGIPDEYLEMNGSYQMTAEQRVEWEAEVRSLYDGMVRIVVTPTWAKLIDFDTTLPSAVEELIREREDRQRQAEHASVEEQAEEDVGEPVLVALGRPAGVADESEVGVGCEHAEGVGDGALVVAHTS